jgi:(4S)-4-hydroxy-5-phosphonooxypentane-2,3-dione isomerase
MPKLAIWATLEIAPGRIEEYLPVILAHKARCLRDEPGTLQFDVLRSRDDDTRVMVYEVYEDEAAFQAHWNGPSVARHRQEAGDMLLKVSGVRFTPAE